MIKILSELTIYIKYCIIIIVKIAYSSMTIFAEANVDVDLRMLRSFRVLRPLKLVSRIPSKQGDNIMVLDILFCFFFLSWPYLNIYRSSNI